MGKIMINETEVQTITTPVGKNWIKVRLTHLTTKAHVEGEGQSVWNVRKGLLVELDLVVAKMARQ